MTNQLDHIVIAHPDLDQAMQEFADLTGCTPQYGGPHVGGGTHNALASLGESIYLEFISPDPAQANAAGRTKTPNLGQRLANLSGSKLLAWAIRCNNLDHTAGRYCGLETAQPFDMSRQQPNGDLLNWRLMNLIHHDLKGFAPFFIDWLDCPHPATTNPLAGEFASLNITHPNPNLVELANNTAQVNSTAGPANFILKFNSARGPVTLSSSELDGFWL